MYCLQAFLKETSWGFFLGGGGFTAGPPIDHTCFTYRTPNGNINKLSLKTLDKLRSLVVEKLYNS